MSPTNTENLKEHLGEAGSHLKQAATAAGGAIKGATGAATDELRIGKANVKAELSDSALSGLAAAEFGGAAAKEQVDALMDKGKDLIDSVTQSTKICKVLNTDLHGVKQTYIFRFDPASDSL